MTTTPAILLEMTPRQALNLLQEGTGLSDDGLAQALGINRRTLQRWRSGAAYPQQVARQRLTALLDHYSRVRETFDSIDAVRLWFNSPSLYLGGITPAEAIRAGRLDRSEGALEVLHSGIFL